MLIAHQGGWDEILLFVAPVVLAIFGVRWAERRMRARREAAIDHAAEDAGPGTASVSPPEHEAEP
ncbi:MAG: hypothetical protein ABWY62_06635 [Acidimicrobiia bacterium]